MLTKSLTIASALLLAACSPLHQKLVITAKTIEVKVELIRSITDTTEQWKFSSSSSSVKQCSRKTGEKGSPCGDIEAGNDPTNITFSLDGTGIRAYCERELKEPVDILFGTRGIASTSNGISIAGVSQEFHNLDASKMTPFTICDDNKTDAVSSYELLVTCRGKSYGTLKSFRTDPKIKNGGGTMNTCS